ncbi:MAG TPA: hypothetical protein VF331_26590 [Polyangiales bacterium]
MIPRVESWLALVCCLAGCALCGCSHAASSEPSVSAGGPTTQDGGQSDAAARPTGPVRGASPVWPPAELEVAVPYRAGDVLALLRMAANPGQLDLQMNIDTTSSMSKEIDALQSELRGSLVPMLAARVDHASFGVSSFEDFPVPPFGADTDHAFRLLSPITDDVSAVENAVAKLDQPLGGGGDNDEAGSAALYQIATGAGYTAAGTSLIERFAGPAASGGGTLGGVGFREHSLHVVLHATDALAHTADDYAAGGLPDVHGMPDAIAALRALPAQVIAIMSTSCTDDACRQSDRYVQLRTQLSELALGTGATMPPSSGQCPTGIGGASLPTYQNTCPLVFDVKSNGEGLAGTVIDSVIGLIDGLRFSEVHAEVSADPLGFVQDIEAQQVPQAKGAEAPRVEDRLPARKPDGRPDTFVDVRQSSQLGFAVRLRNDRLAPSDLPQRFRVMLRIVGDGVVLQERTLRIVVPARNSDGDGGLAPDAAAVPADDAGR